MADIKNDKFQRVRNTVWFVGKENNASDKGAALPYRRDWLGSTTDVAPFSVAVIVPVASNPVVQMFTVRRALVSPCSVSFSPVLSVPRVDEKSAP